MKHLKLAIVTRFFPQEHFVAITDDLELQLYLVEN